MLRLTALACLAPLIASGAACATGPTPEEEVLEAIHALIAADNAGDLEGIVASYSEDAVLVPPQGPPVAGRDAIRDWYGSVLAEGALEVEIDVRDVRVAKSWATSRGTTRGRILWRDGRPPTPFADDFAMTLEESGRPTRWRVTRLLWRSHAAGGVGEP